MGPRSAFDRDRAVTGPLIAPSEAAPDQAERLELPEAGEHRARLEPMGGEHRQRRVAGADRVEQLLQLRLQRCGRVRTVS